MELARWTVLPPEAGVSLQEFLARRLKLSRSLAKRLLDERSVFVNRRRVWMARHTLRAHDVVEAPAPTPPVRVPSPRAPVSAPVLHEDPDFMVFNKPVGVLVVGPDSLEERLRRERGEPALAAAHRLDKDTTGCVLFARNPAAWDTAAALFRERKVLKLYHAIAQGDLRGAPATVNQPIDGQEAVTHFRVLDANRLASHLQVKLETGRTHQVRRHLEALGHPLAGDRAYGTNEQVRREFQAVPRQMLHAARLEFVVPGTGCRVRVEAALPPDFRACLKRLRLR